MMNHVKIPERSDLVAKEMVCPVQQIVEHEAEHSTNANRPRRHWLDCEKGQMLRVEAIQETNIGSGDVNQHHAHEQVIEEILNESNGKDALVFLRGEQPFQSQNSPYPQVIVGIRKGFKKVLPVSINVKAPAEGNEVLIDSFYGIQQAAQRSEVGLQMGMEQKKKTCQTHSSQQQQGLPAATGSAQHPTEPCRLFGRRLK